MFRENVWLTKTHYEKLIDFFSGINVFGKVQLQSANFCVGMNF